MKILVMSVLILLSIFSVAGQKDTLPQSVDEMGSIKCDELLARIDSFNIQLQSSPTTKGIVMISGSNENLIKKVSMEIGFTSGAAQRHMDLSRVTIVHGEETGKPRMEFWIYPATSPTPKSKSWNLTIPRNMKSFYFHTDEDGICVYPTVYTYLKELLASNPRLRVNVVLAQANARKFQRQAESIRKILKTSDRQRVRFFHDRQGNTISADFWLLP